MKSEYLYISFAAASLIADSAVLAEMTKTRITMRLPQYVADSHRGLAFVNVTCDHNGGIVIEESPRGWMWTYENRFEMMQDVAFDSK